MADIHKQCEKCVYWKGVNGGCNKVHLYHFCSYYLDTGKRRVEIDGICKSIKLRTGCEK